MSERTSVCCEAENDKTNVDLSKTREAEGGCCFVCVCARDEKYWLPLQCNILFMCSRSDEFYAFVRKHQHQRSAGICFHLLCSLSYPLCICTFDVHFGFSLVSHALYSFFDFMHHDSS